MNITSFFSQDAKNVVADKLQALCTKGGSITRANLALELGLTEPLPAEVAKAKLPEKAPLLEATEEEKAEYETKLQAFNAWQNYQAHASRNAQIEAILGSMISLGVISGYENRKGPGGGIGEQGNRATKDKSEAPARTVKFPEGFVMTLCGVLHTEIPLDSGSKNRLTRKEIVQKMHAHDPSIQPGSDVENLVSHALRQGELKGYKSYRGPDGGFGLTDEVEVVEAGQAAPVTEPADQVEPVQETQSEEVAQADATSEPVTQTEPTSEPQAPAPKVRTRSAKDGKRNRSKN